MYILSSTYVIPNEYTEVGFADLKKQFFAERPRDVDGVANASTYYFSRKLLRQIFGRFDFKLPDKWPLDYFLSTLFINGEICITDTEAGVIPLRCGHSGINMYNEPTHCIIANPVLGEMRKEIGTECALVRINWNYSGIMDIVNRYAALLAMCDSSLAVTLMNSKVAFIGMASSKQQANTMKKMFDQISMGEPAVFVNGDAVNQENFFFNNVRQNFVGQEIMQVKRMITNDFLTEIGIDNANLEKRERLVTDEVNANDEEIGNNVQHWLDNIRAGFQEANALYGLDLSVTLRKWGKDNELPKPDRLPEDV